MYDDLTREAMDAVADVRLPSDARLVSALLYGSRARGLATPQSDVDIAVIYGRDEAAPPAPHQRDHPRETQSLLSDGTHVEISLYDEREIDSLLARQQLADDHHDALSPAQIRILDDLYHGRPLDSAPWLSNFISRARPRSWAATAAHHYAINCHTLYRDTLGFFETADLASAISTGRRLAEVAHDWLCAINGTPFMRGKWRYVRGIEGESRAGMERTHLEQLIALQLPDHGSKITSSTRIISDCIRLFQRVADWSLVVQGGLEARLPIWTASVLQDSLPSSNMRSLRYYAIASNGGFVMLRDGVPRFELELDFAMAWLLLGIADRDNPLRQMLLNSGIDVDRAEAIEDQFHANAVCRAGDPLLPDGASL